MIESIVPFRILRQSVLFVIFLITGLFGPMSQAEAEAKEKGKAMGESLGNQISDNPYTPILNPDAETPELSYPEIIKRFEEKGYSVNPKTGVVTKPEGSQIDPNNQSSIEKGIGSEGYKALQALLNKMEKEIGRRLSKVTLSSYMKRLGLDMKAGFSRISDYAGVGVAAADIFKMIKKRYEIKSSQKIFLHP